MSKNKETILWCGEWETVTDRTTTKIELTESVMFEDGIERKRTITTYLPPKGYREKN